jgi:glycolate oxidase iron-sulfur subunit
VRALESGAPQRVATANIGCLAHLEAGLNSSSKVPIRHWIELIDGRLQEGR